MQNAKLQIICFKKTRNVCTRKHVACLWKHRDYDKFAKQDNHKNKVSLETKVAKISLMYSCKVYIYFVAYKKRFYVGKREIHISRKFFRCEPSSSVQRDGRKWQRNSRHLPCDRTSISLGWLRQSRVEYIHPSCYTEHQCTYIQQRPFNVL